MIAAGVRRVVQISALGIEGSATRYARSKLAAEACLRSLADAGQIDPVVLRPSVVFGKGGDSSALFMTLARLPVVVFPAPMLTARIQPVSVHDLAAAVVALLGPALQHTGTVACTGPEPVRMADFVASLRQQQGHGKGEVAATTTEIGHAQRRPVQSGLEQGVLQQLGEAGHAGLAEDARHVAGGKGDEVIGAALLVLARDREAVAARLVEVKRPAPQVLLGQHQDVARVQARHLLLHEVQVAEVLGQEVAPPHVREHVLDGDHVARAHRQRRLPRHPLHQVQERDQPRGRGPGEAQPRRHLAGEHRAQAIVERGQRRACGGCEEVEFGLLRGAFRPADEVCALRALSRQREMLLRQQMRSAAT